MQALILESARTDKLHGDQARVRRLKIKRKLITFVRAWFSKVDVSSGRADSLPRIGDSFKSTSPWKVAGAQSSPMRVTRTCEWTKCFMDRSQSGDQKSANKVSPRTEHLTSHSMVSHLMVEALKEPNQASGVNVF